MNLKCLRSFASIMTAASLMLSFSTGAFAQPQAADDFSTTTPIKHVVVIFQENVSFDHYFATYPYAANDTNGEPQFNAKDDTPSVNNLLSGGLLTSNPNTVQPFRLSRSEAVTCDQDHNYNDEQTAFNHGAMDDFVAGVGSGNGNLPSPLPATLLGVPLQSGQASGTPYMPNQYYQTSSTSFSGYCFDAGKGKGVVMGYYDGNTVTAFWNYAQHFAMSDNSYSTTFGPSAPGAINLVSGTTADATLVPTTPNGSAASPSGLIWGGKAAVPATTGSLIGDARPAYDDCVNSNSQLQKTNQVFFNESAGVPANVGDLMGDLSFPAFGHEVTWGWFMGGFAPTNGARLPAVCGSAHTGIAGFGPTPLPDNVLTVGDYIPHHQPFEFYASTSNPHHLPPSKESMIGKTDQANHQYDLTAFFTALKDGNMPAVSYLKAAAYQDGHPGYSDPLDEQSFVVTTINAIMASPDWKSTAIIIAYDDSDGWYDHAMDPLVNQSGIAGGADDQLTNPGFCGTASPAPAIQGRCGYGPRQPLLVISPYAKKNYVDHTITDQSSILRFIEDNWGLGRVSATSNDNKAGSLLNMFDFDENRNRDRKDQGDDGILLLNPATGRVINGK
jgi:phospholipase C